MSLQTNEMNYLQNLAHLQIHLFESVPTEPFDGAWAMGSCEVAFASASEAHQRIAFLTMLHVVAYSAANHDQLVMIGITT